MIMLYIMKYVLDALMNLVAELVINKTRLAQIGSEYNLQELSETLSHVDRVTSDLQAVVTKARMVPIETVFSRFPRMVRDISREKNKQIELEIVGSETSVDKKWNSRKCDLFGLCRF